jgi:hypothetical protein
MIRDQDADQNDLNKNNLEINRGVELLLRNKERRNKSTKTFSVKIGKLICLFKREIHIEFEFFIDIKKDQTSTSGE